MSGLHRPTSIRSWTRSFTSILTRAARTRTLSVRDTILLRMMDLRKNGGAGTRVFCNPPYGREIGKWVKKCYEESKDCDVVVMLIPARTDTAYFHDYIYHKAKEIRFIRGRLHFNDSKQGAPFPSMVVVF